MFERLLQLPLFQGMTTQEVSDVISHVRLDFANYHRGDEIVMQGESCRKLIYIIRGRSWQNTAMPASSSYSPNICPT